MTTTARTLIPFDNVLVQQKANEFKRNSTNYFARAFGSRLCEGSLHLRYLKTPAFLLIQEVPANQAVNSRSQREAAALYPTA